MRYRRRLNASVMERPCHQRARRLSARTLRAAQSEITASLRRKPGSVRAWRWDQATAWTIRRRSYRERGRLGIVVGLTGADYGWEVGFSEVDHILLFPRG
jgi:hypothetical protein